MWSASAAWEEGTVAVRFDAAVVPATALLGAVEAVGYGAALSASASTSSLRVSSLSRTGARGRPAWVETLGTVGAELLSSLLFVCQLSIGYFLMLLIMTYHAPFVVFVVLGIGLGHTCVTIFETYVASPATALGAAALDGGSAEPCCEATIEGGGHINFRESLL